MTAPLTSPRLRNDCFAMPQGMEWVLVDEALALLRARLHAVTGTEDLAAAHAHGRVLAAPAVARGRIHPGPIRWLMATGSPMPPVARASSVCRLWLVVSRRANHLMASCPQVMPCAS